MAIFRWRGNGAGTKSAWNDGRNWVDQAGSAYPQARYPGSVAGVNDEVIFDTALVTGASPPAGRDCSADAKLKSFTVGEAYASDIASSGAYLQIEATDVVINGATAGNIYLHGIGTDGLQNLTVIDSAGTCYVKGRAEVVQLLKGTVAFADSSTIATSLDISYTSDPANDVVLTLGSSMTLPTSITAGGGTVTCNTAVNTLRVNAGSWIQAAGDVTTLTLAGGTFIWAAGNITTAYIYTGELDGSDYQTHRRVGAVYLYPGGEFNYDDGAGTIHITDRIYHLGGTLDAPANAELARYMDATYTGVNNAVQGISPQSITSTAANGSALYVAPYDRVTIICTCGAIAGGGAVSFQVQEDDNSAFSSAASYGDAMVFTDADDNKTLTLTLNGYDLVAGNTYIRVVATESGGGASLVSAQYVKWAE